MNESSILKRTLLLTGKLVGIFSIWIAVLSLVAVTAAGRIVIALSGSSADPGASVPAETTKKGEGGTPRVKSQPVNATNKPNG